MKPTIVEEVMVMIRAAAYSLVLPASEVSVSPEKHEAQSKKGERRLNKLLTKRNR